MNTEGELPSNISQVVRSHTIALALAHTLWAPPHALCLRAAARRLVELMDLLPLEFAALEKKGMPKRGQIIEWVYWLESVLRGISSPSKADLDIAISPIDALNRATGTKVRHPLSGYGMTEFPVYSLLLITPPSDDVGRAGFDKIAAYAAWFGISEHLSYSSDEYLHFVDTFQSYKSGNLSGSEWQDVAPFVLSKQGRLDNARRAVAALQQSASLSPLIAQAGHAERVSDIIYVINEIIQSLNHENSYGHRRLAGQINGLITLFNDKPPREYSTETKRSPESFSAQNVSEDQSSSIRSSKSENIGTLEKREGTYYQLETLFLEPEAPDESDASIPLLYENESDPEDWDENGEEDDKAEHSKQEISRVEREEQLEPSTLQVWSLNKLEFTRRIAEQQPFGLDYVCMDSRTELIGSLTNIVRNNQDKQESLAASYILATIVTGRRLQSLLGGVIAHDCPEPRTDNQLLIVEPTSRTLQLRLNKPELRLAPAKSSLKVGEWITVPDHLGISLSLLPLSLSEQVNLLRKIEEILPPLLITHQLRLEQLSQLLPRTMLELEGNFCTASLITDWNAGNIAVNRHYLTPAATTVAHRYSKALETMLDLPKHAVPPQSCEYVGHPNTLPLIDLRRTIHQLSSVTPGMSLQMRHNHITVMTVILLSLAIGMRATVNVQPGGIQLSDNSIAHFKEKGFVRLVCLPELVVQQLVAYEQHLSLLKFIWNKQFSTEAPHENLFFIFNDAETTEAFAPMRISEYLGRLGVESDMEIRSLRRIVFTWLYEHGGHGRAIDHFISHAINGSQAYVLYSGVQTGDLRKIADFIQQQLIAMDWPLAAGINHHHAAFRN